VAQYAEGEASSNGKGKVRFSHCAENWLVYDVICSVPTRCIFCDGGNQNRRDKSSKDPNRRCSHS
jgi:hypothetical protein